MYYAVRIHKEFAELDFLEALPCFIVLERDAMREHYQGIVQWEKTPQALRVMVKKNCPNAVGNQGYSVKQCREEYGDYLTYLCKGTVHTLPDVVLNTMGVNDIDIRWSRYWTKNKELKCSRKKKSIIGEVKKEFPWTNPTCANVTKSVLDYLIEHEKPINMSYIQGLVLLIMSKEDSNYRTKLCSSLIKKNNLLL